MLQILPETRTVRVVLANDAGLVPEALLPSLRKVSPEPAPEPIDIDPADLAPYPGVYQLGPAHLITVTTRGGTLFAQLTGQPAFPVFMTRDDYFEYDIVTAALEFERDDDGQVTGLILHQNGRHTAPKR